MIGPFGRQGPAGTLRQHCPQMTQRPCRWQAGLTLLSPRTCPTRTSLRLIRNWPQLSAPAGTIWSLAKGRGWTCLWGQRSQTNAFAFVVSCHSASRKEATIDMEGGNTNGTEYTAEKKWFEKVMSRRETREKISFFSKMNEWDFLYCAQVIEDLHCIGLGRRNTGSVGLCVDRKTSELTQKNATITTTDTDTN